jgi:hypothetical protein
VKGVPVSFASPDITQVCATGVAQREIGLPEVGTCERHRAGGWGEKSQREGGDEKPQRESCQPVNAPVGSPAISGARYSSTNSAMST